MKPKKNIFTRAMSQPQIILPIEDFIYNKNNTNNNSNIIDILNVINSALNVETAKKNFSKNNFYTKNDLLLKTKENSIINFLNSLQNKNILNIKNKFLSEINENTKNGFNKINEYKTLTKNNMTKYDIILEENKNINKEISKMNNEQRKLDLELRKSQNMISLMQINDQNLKEYRLLYDEFLKYYPGKDPVNQMKELKINKNTFLNTFKEYNDLQLKLEIENKEDQRRFDQEKKNIKKCYRKI
jgi:hypothetical protein